MRQLSETLLSEPAGESYGFLAERPGLGCRTELRKWRAVQVFQVPYVNAELREMDLLQEVCEKMDLLKALGPQYERDRSGVSRLHPICDLKEGLENDTRRCGW